MGKRLRNDERLWEELAYCVPLGVPHSEFLGWSDSDQDKALAFRKHEARRCRCGTMPEDWEGDDTAFVGWQDPPCPGCTAISQENENVEKSSLTDHEKRAVRVRLVPRALAMRLIEQGEEGAAG